MSDPINEAVERLEARPWTPNCTELLWTIATDENFAEWTTNPTLPEFLRAAAEHLRQSEADVKRWHDAYEIAHEQATQNGTALRQSKEREAVMREALAGAVSTMVEQVARFRRYGKSHAELDLAIKDAEAVIDRTALHSPDADGQAK